MKQVLQNLKTGIVELVDVPHPVAEPGRVIVRVEISLISAGTESHQVSSGAKSLLERALEKPQLIRKGLKTLAERGVSGLREQIASKYEGYAALGYSCAGRVIAHGPDVTGVRIGQRVACGGIGYANHAEIVSVPVNLIALAPEHLSAESAAYATLGAIAMQGVRQADAKLGEGIAVIGLGLVGLLTVQLLKAAGCTVIGIDPGENARRRGIACGAVAATDASGAAAITAAHTRGIGADATIICAAATGSDPVVLAGEITRSRGRVVMVGSTGMEIPRELYFRKELVFLLSRSYGPGRYDPHYEEQGLDYPVDFVRFTEQRNLQSFLDLAAAGRIDTNLLTTHRFALNDAPDAYQVLTQPGFDRAGILLDYPGAEVSNPWKNGTPNITTIGNTPAVGKGLGLIGAGAYARNAILPMLKQHAGTALAGVASRNSAQAISLAKQFNFAFASTDPVEVLSDPNCRAVFIVTRHDSHASLTIDALKAGKSVWVEKPLALNLSELQAVAKTLAQHPRQLVVGFNRPFSPLATWLRSTMEPQAPMMMRYRVNAGMIPASHWTNDPAAGGGRLLGEGCHFLDFMRWFCQSTPVSVHTAAMRSDRTDLPPTANFAVNVTFANGSIGQLFYTSQGSPTVPKEHFEVSCGDRTGILDDYCAASVVTGSGAPVYKKTGTQDKGQSNLMSAFLHSLDNGPAAMNPADIFLSTQLTLAAQASLEREAMVRMDTFT
jgi:predicted dehydrogenase/threonine dehydrogenase-like Zn-dependent dehydrogenase